MTDEWLSLSDAAKLLGVHPSTVRLWSDKGVLPTHRTSGGHRRYRRNEVLLWAKTAREIRVEPEYEGAVVGSGDLRLGLLLDPHLLRGLEGDCAHGRATLPQGIGAS